MILCDEGSVLEAVASKCLRTPGTAEEHLKKRSRTYNDEYVEVEPSMSRETYFAHEERSGCNQYESNIFADISSSSSNRSSYNSRTDELERS